MREPTWLRTRYRALLSYTGVTLALAGALELTPLLEILARPEESGLAGAFLGPAGVEIVAGLAAWRLLRPDTPPALTVQEGGVIVLLTWVLAACFAAWPFAAVLHLDATRAVFESVSGWTTTGLSVVDVETAPRTILLWRSVLQLAGGAGLAILMLSAVLGPQGSGFSAAEGRGDQLVPHVRRSARLVLLIYAGYAVLGVAAYLLVGLSPFDAVNHAFAAVSTGGFSTWGASIGHWDSVAVEAVTIPLMILGNLSFLTAWALIRGRLGTVARNGEIRLTAWLLPLSIAVLFLGTTRWLYPELPKAFRVAVFEATSALTTTGFSTVSYGAWNGLGVLLLIVLMLAGGGTCSTAGGLKQMRVYRLGKAVAWEVRRALLPRTAVDRPKVWEGESRIVLREGELWRLGSFAFLYVATWLVAACVITASGYALAPALFEAASALGTVGLSVGVTAVGAPGSVLWTETVAMLLGRLEFFVVFVSAIKIARDVARMLPHRTSAGARPV